MTESGRPVPARFTPSHRLEVKAAWHFWPRTAAPAPSPSGAPRGPAGREGSGALRSEGRAVPPPRPRPRPTGAKQPGESREEGPRPRPAPKPRGQNRNPARRKRNAARPVPPDPARRRVTPPTGARWPPPPLAPPRPEAPHRADESPPPTAGPPSLARLPALLGHGPLHPSRLLTALRRIPLGGCAAILSELQSQDRPRPQPDWEAAGTTVGPAGPAHFRGGARGCPARPLPPQAQLY